MEFKECLLVQPVQPAELFQLPTVGPHLQDSRRNLRRHMKVGLQMVGNIDARDGSQPEEVGVILCCLYHGLEVILEIHYEVDQAQQAEVSSSPEVSPGVAALEPYFLPQVVDQGEVPLVGLAHQVLAAKRHAEELF